MVIQNTPTKIDKIASLRIGQRGENLATDIKMDVSDWITVHPDANYYCLFKRPDEVQVQPVLSSLEEDVLTWTVRAWECAVIGVGYLEVRAVNPDTGLVAKSRVIPCAIEDSVIDDEGPVPPEMSWVGEVLAAKDTAVAAKTAAEEARDTAQTTVNGAVAGIQAEGQTQVGVVQAEGATQVGAVQSEGTTQVGAVQAKGTEVLNSIPSDYTELSDDVTGLKSAFGETSTVTIFDVQPDGYTLLNSSGVIKNSSTALKVYYCKVVKGVTYTINHHDTSSSLFCAFYTTVPLLGSVSYDGQRINQTSNKIVSPIDGYMAFRSAGTRIDESVISKNAVDPIARSELDKIEPESNNLVTELLSGYWTNATLETRAEINGNYRSIKEYLTAGEYTISFGVDVNIIRLCIDGIFIDQTIFVGSGQSFSFRCRADGYIGISFVAEGSGAWNTWVLLEHGETLGNYNYSAVDLVARKKPFGLPSSRAYGKTSLLKGYFNGDTYTKSNNRLTTFDFIEVHKGDVIKFLNLDIAIAFVKFDFSGNFIGTTPYISSRYISANDKLADTYIVDFDGYTTLNMYDRAKGGNVALNPYDYDNFIQIIYIHSQTNYIPVYLNQAMLSNMKSKRINTEINGQDGLIIGDTLYSFGDGSASGGPINAIDLSTMRSRLAGTHTLGHANSIDYCTDNDTLITYGSNGNNQPTIVLYQNPDFNGNLSLSDDECVVVPLYDDSSYMNVSGSLCFGESSSIAYFVEGVYSDSGNTLNPVRKIYKILLGMGDNDLSGSGYGTYIDGKSSDQYNGTCQIIKTYTGEIVPGVHCFANASSLWTPQGMKFNGYLYLAYGTAGNNYLKIALNDYAETYTVINNYHFEVLAYNGEIVPCEPEMLAIKDNKMYCGVNDRSTHANYLYELQLN